MRPAKPYSVQTKGFTLIELLIVIGIIGFLAAAVLIAVDPVRRIQDARDARRYSEANALLNAVLNAQNDLVALYPGDISGEGGGGEIIDSNAFAQVIVKDATGVVCDNNSTRPSCPQLPLGYTLATSADAACVARLNRLALAPGPLTATLAGAGAGNVTLGQHTYKVTFVNPDGETELGAVSNAANASVTDGKVNLSGIPVAASGAFVTARRIYRNTSATSPAGPWMLLATINDNATTTYTDNISDANLGGAGPDTNSTGLSPKYIADLPVDPGTSVVINGLPLGSTNTGYYIIRAPGGKRLSIGACYGEANTAIRVQR